MRCHIFTTKSALSFFFSFSFCLFPSPFHSIIYLWKGTWAGSYILNRFPSYAQHLVVAPSLFLSLFFFFFFLLCVVVEFSFSVRLFFCIFAESSLRSTSDFSKEKKEEKKKKDELRRRTVINSTTFFFFYFNEKRRGIRKKKRQRTEGFCARVASTREIKKTTT